MDEIWLPNDIIDELLMNMKIEEILERSRISKRWKERVNTLWYRLLERDFDVKGILDVKSIDDNKEIYKNNYLIVNSIIIKENDIHKVVYETKKIRDRELYKKQICNVIKRAFFDYDNGIFKFNANHIMVITSITSPLYRGGDLPRPFITLYSFGLYDINNKTLSDVLLSRMFKSILPFTFIYETKNFSPARYIECKISISLKNYILIYNYLNGKDSFDLAVMNYIKKMNIIKNLSYYMINVEPIDPLKSLELIHEIANN